MSKPGRETYTLTLTDCGTPADGPAIRRLRAALKRLLRGYALRCVSVVEVHPDPPDQARAEPSASH